MVKSNEEQKASRKMIALVLLSLCILLSVMAQVVMKRGMNEICVIESFGALFDLGQLFKIVTNKFVFTGLVAYAIAMIFWLGALSQLDVSFMYPLLSLGYVLIALFAMAFLGETVTLERWIGIILIIIGVYFIFSSKTGVGG